MAGSLYHSLYMMMFRFLLKTLRSGPSIDPPVFMNFWSKRPCSSHSHRVHSFHLQTETLPPLPFHLQEPFPCGTSLPHRATHSHQIPELTSAIGMRECVRTAKVRGCECVNWLSRGYNCCAFANVSVPFRLPPDKLKII